MPRLHLLFFSTENGSSPRSLPNTSFVVLSIRLSSCSSYLIYFYILRVIAEALARTNRPAWQLDRKESIPLRLCKNNQYYLGMERPSTSIAPENSNRILSNPIDRTINLENQQIKDDFTIEDISDLREIRWLYLFFPLWIFLAVVVGIMFRRLVPNMGPALEKGMFVGVPASSGW